MTRDFQITGPFMVQLQFSPSVPLASGTLFDFTGSNSYFLGLTEESAHIEPNFYHRDVLTDSFGESVPADTLCYMSDAVITFKLIHYDPNPLDFWLRESLAGGGTAPGSLVPAGTMPFAGTPMGGGVPLYTLGNHYVGLGFSPADSTQLPWRFPATYLTGPPVRYPIGAQASIVEIRARAIPYAPLPSPSQTGTTPLNGVGKPPPVNSTLDGFLTTDPIPPPTQTIISTQNLITKPLNPIPGATPLLKSPAEQSTGTASVSPGTVNASIPATAANATSFRAILWDHQSIF